MDEQFLKKIAKVAEESSMIDQELYDKYNVKRGLRNKDFTGVLVGLTHIGNVTGYKKVDKKTTPIEGDLLYRGISIKKLIEGYQKDSRQGFDETTFLLLFGKLPTKKELELFSNELSELRTLPHDFSENMILNLKGNDMMNMLARYILALYTLDKDADDISTLNILRQSLNLIAKFPSLIIHSYQAMMYQYDNLKLSIRQPKKNLTTAENFLYMLKGDKKYTKLEAEILDIVLVLHAEHGGGNNSTFTMHVISSSNTDTYSAVAAAIGSLKGPLHGGANLRVSDMVNVLKEGVKDWKSDEQVIAYLKKILNKEVGDKSGKIYGFGHAVYTLSDPRAVILKQKAKELSQENNNSEEFELYERVEKLVPSVIKEVKGLIRPISANVDFYSGFIYQNLGIPKELNTPLFVMARIVGWCAHRLEEIISSRKIIRPRYKNVAPINGYLPLDQRKD